MDGNGLQLQPRAETGRNIKKMNMPGTCEGPKRAGMELNSNLKKIGKGVFWKSATC